MLIDEIQTGLAISRHELLLIIATAPKRYKVYQIDERNGQKRTIAQPARELKAIQYYLLENFLNKMPVHDIATAYVKGKNIKHNADFHRKSGFILKLDFVNFFNSIVPRDFDRVLRVNNMTLSSQDRSMLKNTLFWGQKTRTPVCLSIGAPTSPALSNIIMYDIDVFVANLAVQLDARVTRYADDITVSADSMDQLLRFERNFAHHLSRTSSPKLKLNDDKRGIYSRGERRMVTGLVVTPDQKISIGRARKREISTLIHTTSLGQLLPEEILYLKGYLAFANSIEPEFQSSMKRKYGLELITFIMSYQPEGF